MSKERKPHDRDWDESLTGWKWSVECPQCAETLMGETTSHEHAMMPGRAFAAASETLCRHARESACDLTVGPIDVVLEVRE